MQMRAKTWNASQQGKKERRPSSKSPAIGGSPKLGTQVDVVKEGRTRYDRRWESSWVLELFVEFLRFRSEIPVLDLFSVDEERWTVHPARLP